MNVAFIPVRGGSKSIPFKNITPMNGKPLVYWTVKAACECAAIDRVYVSTDSDRIRDCVQGFAFPKLEVVGRSAAVSTDTASTESTMLEFAESHQFDNIALVQATSPLLDHEALDRGFALFARDDVDSVLSVVRQKRFHWQCDAQGVAVPTNYDVFHRPRRQEFEGYLVENGAFYITSRDDLLRTRNRVSGRIHVVEMDEDTFFEIDEPSDWIIVEALMKRKGVVPCKPAAPIKMLLTDCDGCLTDGGMYYTREGDEIKKFNTKDGMGFSFLRERGVLTGIVTGESISLVRNRATKLQLDILEMGVKDKLATVKRLCEQHDVAPENVAYIGDDVNDVEAIAYVGFGCCVQDGVPEAKRAAKYVTQARGGQGAIREVIDLLLQAR